MAEILGNARDAMMRALAIALTSSAFVCASCATAELADYPANHWPPLIYGATCTSISGRYQDRTEDVWPTVAMRGSKATGRASLAQQLARVSPTRRPQDFLAVRSVEIAVGPKQARMFGELEELMSLSNWQCTEDGALAASHTREANGELSINAKVEIRLELRRAADQSLVVHSVQQFSDLSIKKLLRESWYRFHPEPSP